MYNDFRSILTEINTSLDTYSDHEVKKLYDNLLTLFLKKGMINSIVTGRPVDGENNFLPWYTYSAIDYLNQLDFSQNRVIEFGSGYSTLFWSKHAKHVTSVERDAQWFVEVSNKVDRDNINLLLFENAGDYFSYIDTIKDNEYDVIVIDGRDRYATTVEMHKLLKTGGILIFDNSDWYPDSCAYLRAQDYTQVDFAGFGPINNYTWCTSLFFKTNITIPHKRKMEFVGKLDVIKDDDSEKQT